MAILSKIEEAAQKHNLTLDALALRTGISGAELSRMNTGRIQSLRFTTLAAICKELRCQPGDLFLYVPDEQVDRPPRR